jgi:hypothetical protein
MLRLDLIFIGYAKFFLDFINFFSMSSFLKRKFDKIKKKKKFIEKKKSEI